MRLGTKIHLECTGHPTDPDQNGINVHMEGTMPDIVLLLIEAMDSHEAIRAVVSAAADSFKSPMIQDHLQQRRKKVVIVKDSFEKVTKH